MHKPTGVRGLSLRGSSFGPKARVRKKKPASTTPRVPAVGDVTPSIVPITSIDALVKELRKTLHGMFASLDANIATTNLYDNCSQQAFRFFTTTNTITPEAFHHKINKLGLHGSKKLCVELFRLVDQEDLGELTYATFSSRIFLPAGYFNFSKPSTATPTAPSPQRPSSASSRHSGCQASGSQAAPSSPWGRRPPTPTRPASQPTSVHLIYEHLPLAEIERHISRKLEERTSKSTDRFRQSFRIFTKSEGITLAEFQYHLGLMQINLTHAKCKELFNRFDLDRNGTIELSEFTAALFKHEENESDLVRTSTPSRPSAHGGAHGGAHTAHHALRLEDFDVEAGVAWTIQEILSRLRQKLEQHTSKETDRFRQAFKIFAKSHGITKPAFNIAMTKLGLKLTDTQLHDLFILFDFDKSGDLDLNEFVQGVMLDDNSTQHWYSLKDKQKVAESRKMMYSMAVQSVQESWTIAEIEQMLREKIEQRTSRSSDCFRQAFRIFKKVNGIHPTEFHAALESIGLPLDRSQADVLFQRFDTDGSGDIDLDEFIHGVLPPDYTGRQWVAAADELHKEAAQKKKREAVLNPDRYMTEIEMENWNLDEIEKRIRDKIQQATSKSSDTFRQAFKIFKKTNHVTMDEFRERLLALGFRLTPSQCLGLFQRYDTNNSGDIDLQEFCMRILPPDYTGDGDHWSHSEKFHKQREQEQREYVRRSKNGLLMLPKFEESRVRYRRGQHDSYNAAAADVEDSNSTVSSGGGDGGTSSDVTMVRPASPACRSRPSTPRTPKQPRPTSASSQQQQQQQQRPGSATSSSRCDPAEDAKSPRTRQLQRPPTPKSPRPEMAASTQPTSPRTTRVATTASSQSNTPSRPTSAARQHQQQQWSESTSSSPRRPLTPRSHASATHWQKHDDEDEEVIYEDTEERDEEEADEQLTSQSLRLLRAKRAEAAHRHRRHHEQQANDEPASRGSGSSSRGSCYDRESVSGESTASYSSTAQRAVGAAKYTPARSNVLLLQRFMRVAAKRHDERAPGHQQQQQQPGRVRPKQPARDQAPPRPQSKQTTKGPHTNRS